MPNPMLKSSHLGLQFITDNPPLAWKKVFTSAWEGQEKALPQTLIHEVVVPPSSPPPPRNDSLHQQVILTSGNALHRVSASPPAPWAEAVICSQGDLALLGYMHSVSAHWTGAQLGLPICLSLNCPPSSPWPRKCCFLRTPWLCLRFFSHLTPNLWSIMCSDFCKTAPWPVVPMWLHGAKYYGWSYMAYSCPCLRVFIKE